MASFIFCSFTDDVSKGNIIGNADTFKLMLVTAAPNQTTALKRSDITNEASGTGYSSGGTTTTVTVAKDTAGKKETWTFSNPSWASSTISAIGGVIYKSRGGASSADELVQYADFSGTIVSTGGTFSVTFSTPLTFSY